MTAPKRMIVVPCSGIGKSYGSVSREAAYLLTEDYRPESTKLVALSLLVLGDEEAREAVEQNPALTVDGCKLACASKMVQENGGSVVRELAVLDVFRQHREMKPSGIAELNEGGHKLAQVLAEEAAAVVDTVLGDRGRGVNA